MPQTRELQLEAERDRFQKQREDLIAKRSELDDQLSAIEQELYALDVYVQAKAGKRFDLAKPTPTAKGTRGPSGKRGELGGKRKEVYDYIVAHPQGLFASEVIKHFNPSGDDKIKSAVNAALFNLKKQGRISQSEPRAQYVAAGKTDQPEAAATDEEAA